jgi:hypothetical protein
MIEGQKSRSRFENTKFLSILKVLQPFWKLPNAPKQLVLLSKLKNFAYGYIIYIILYYIILYYIILYIYYIIYFMYTESFACGGLRGLMFSLSWNWKRFLWNIAGNDYLAILQRQRWRIWSSSWADVQVA